MHVCMCMQMNTSLFRGFSCQKAEFYNAGSYMNGFMHFNLCVHAHVCVAYMQTLGAVHSDSRLYNFMRFPLCVYSLFSIGLCVCVQ